MAPGGLTNEGNRRPRGRSPHGRPVERRLGHCNMEVTTQLTMCSGLAFAILAHSKPALGCPLH